MRIITVLAVSFLSLFELHAQEWQTSFEEAKKLSKESGHPIILVFQGSDWCAPCMKLEKEIWSSDYFKTYAKEHYIMLLADFPRRKQNALSEEQTTANAILAEKYNIQGAFPLVVKLTSEGKVIGRTGYKKMSPEEYAQHLDSLK